MNSTFSSRIGRIGLALAITLTAALPSGSDNTTIIYNSSPIPGTYGNDTVSSLYLRPLNNAAVGPAAFGSGYPHSPTSYPYPIAADQSGNVPVHSGNAPGQSGILRANAYLQSSGWSSWQKEKATLIVERQLLTDRVQFLERKLSGMEKQLEELRKMITSKENAR